MKKVLKWKRGIFNNTYQLFLEDIPVGQLREKTWTQSADGELNGKKYNFKTKGFFKPETQIIETESGSTIGKITYNPWMTKARIECDNKVANWKYNNVWNTKWSLFDSEGIQINYQGSFTKGKIEFDDQNDVLALTGLYIINYYWQLAIPVIVAILIPIWISAMN